MADFNLSACVMIISSLGNLYYSTANVVAPLEKEILYKLHGEKRFLDFGCRTQVNYPQIALLIKNMPLDDRPRYGRIKDTVPFILGAADAKIRVLDTEKSLIDQNDRLVHSVHVLENTLANVTSKITRLQSDTTNVMEHLSEAMNLQLHKIGLEQDQEEYVLEEINKAADLLRANALNTQPIEKTLKELHTHLSDLALAQKRIIEENLSVDNKDTNDITDDIELF